MDFVNNKQIVGEFFERFCKADTALALELLDDDVVWRAMGRQGGLPVSGEMDKVEIGQLIDNVAEIFSAGFELTATGWTIEGDRIALEMESNARKKNGIVYNNFYHFLVILKDRKILTVREYFDTLHVKEVFLDN